MLLLIHHVTYNQVYNYNKCSDDTYRGVKTLKITLDDKPLYSAEGTVNLRRGPGSTHYDFGQVRMLSFNKYKAGNSL